MVSAVMEDYLKAIYHRQQETDDEVSTSEIADHLDVTAPTISNMFDRLEDQELLNREKYKGVSLIQMANGSLSKLSDIIGYLKHI